MINMNWNVYTHGPLGGFRGELGKQGLEGIEI